MLVAWNTEENCRARAVFVRSLSEIVLSNIPIIYVDETGFNLGIHKSKSRSIAEEPLLVLYLKEALSITELFIHVQTKKMDQEQMQKTRGSVIVQDNCKIHHAQNLNTLWEMAFQTFLNPIEYAFNALKILIKEASFRDRGELVKTIQEKAPLITSEMAEGFFKRSFRGKPLEPIIPEEESASHSTVPLFLEGNQTD